MNFEPDYRHVVEAAWNRRPARLCLYEHLVNMPFMERALDRPFADLQNGDEADLGEFFAHTCRFWREMTYDTVSFEVCITSILPDGGALLGERPGVIQTRDDFDRYPWADLPRRYWDLAEPQFRILAERLPPGMKAVGGVGNGVFEIAQDLVGFEELCYMQADDPALFADVFRRVGDLMVSVWTEFLARHAGAFALCRFGDDLGFKTATLLAPRTVVELIVPQYARVVSRIRRAGGPFLFHCCGNVFEVMEAILSVGINAKHSNEDAIAPFEEWIRRYGSRIGLFGGIDVDILCRQDPACVFEEVLRQGLRYREIQAGYALGSGNSIPEYVPLAGYLAMVRACQEIRRREATP